MLAAAAIEKPDAPDRNVRLSAEENSLTVFLIFLRFQSFRVLDVELTQDCVFVARGEDFGCGIWN
jgi:hypothetical protein